MNQSGSELFEVYYVVKGHIMDSDYKISSREKDKDDKPKSEESMLLMLPPELLYHIFSYLNGKDLTVCCCVCKDFHAMLSEPRYWKRVMARDGVSKQVKELWQCKPQNGKMQTNNRLPRACHLQRTYAQYVHRTHNWKVGTYRSVYCNTGMFSRCVDSNGQLIVVAGMKSEWEIWAMEPQVERLACVPTNREIEAIKMDGCLVVTLGRGQVTVYKIHVSILKHGEGLTPPSKKSVYRLYSLPHLDYTTDDKCFAIGEGFLVLGDHIDEQRLKLWKAKSGCGIGYLPIPFRVRRKVFAISIVNLHVYGSFLDRSGAGIILGWRLKGIGLVLQTVVHSSAISRFVVSNCGTRAFSCDTQGNFSITSTNNGMSKFTFSTDEISSPMFSVSSTLEVAAITKSHSVVCVFRLSDGQEICRINHNMLRRRDCLQYLYVQDEFVLTCSICEGYVWELPSGKLLHKIEWPSNLALFCTHEFFINKSKIIISSQGLLVIDFS